MKISPKQTHRAQDHHPLKGGNGHLPAELRLSEVAMVGSHNSACAKQYGWLYAQQKVTITQQFLNCGARFFKIPVHWFYAPNAYCHCGSVPESERKPYIALAHEGDGHSNCKLSVIQRGLRFPQRAVTAYRELFEIAEHYADEVFVLLIEDWIYHYRGESNGTQQLSDEQVAIELDKILEESELKQKAYKLNGQMPTLGEMRQGKNVVIFIDVEEITKFKQLDYVHHFYKYTAQVNWEESPDEYTYKKNLVEGRGTYDEDGNIIEPFFLFHLNPEASLSFFPYGEKINSYKVVKKRYNYMKKLYNVHPNFMTSDYIEQGSIFSVVDEANLVTVEEEIKK